MNKAEIQAIVDGATGAPDTGAVAAVIPAIVDALDTALNPQPTPPAKAKRVIEADETR